MSEDKFHKPVDAATRLSELREGKKSSSPEGEPAILEADEIDDLLSVDKDINFE